MLNRLTLSIKRRLWYLFNKSAFNTLGKQSYFKNPLYVQGKENMIIGKNVYVGYKSWLAAVANTGSKSTKLVIGSGTMIGNFNHIYATQLIKIGEKVLIADKVYISDNLHDYENVHEPVLSQPIRQISSVTIADGAWLGENVCIIGASVGKNSVIGANSVVTRDIPDYCVAVGSPAKVIKRYCFDTQQWKKTDINGKFLIQ